MVSIRQPGIFFLALLLLGFSSVFARAQSAKADEPLPPPTPILRAVPEVVEAPNPPQIEAAKTKAKDQPLPISLPAALRLADARPLVIAAATAGVATELGRLEQARALWLPTLYIGTDFQRHDGSVQRTEGSIVSNSRDQLLVGGGARAVFALTDALYEPLAE